ncbi:MAG: hypothetical protein ABW154_09355 [Dyella sp.]
MIALGTWLLNRRAVETRPDERDAAIASRSRHAAYNTLMAGMIMVGVVMPFSHSGWDIVNAALLAIAVSEVVHHRLIALAYRRGVHA